MSKITIFLKILTSITSDFSARYNTPTCAWSNCKTKKLKNFQKIAGGDDFSQKVGFWPPQPAKSAIHEISTKMGPYTKSFFHHFQTTCKVSSTSDGSFPRSQNFLHPGSLVKGILSGRAPYPANLGKTCYLNVWTRPPRGQAWPLSGVCLWSDVCPWPGIWYEAQLVIS